MTRRVLMSLGLVRWSVVVGAGVIGAADLPLPVVHAQPPESIVLEDFLAKEPDGFPSNWEHEKQRSEAKGRDAYKVQSENGSVFLAARDAGQRIKKKKIDWDPKAYPILTWRWRLHKAPSDSEPIAAIYASLDTDLMFIPVFTKYVWSASKPEGSLTEGGMFSGSEIVVQGGLKPIGEWVEERVNVYEDFKRIHQHEPAPKAWGISILTGPGVDIDVGSITASAGR